MLNKPLTVDMRGAPFSVDLLGLNDKESMLMLAIDPGTSKESVMVLILDKDQVRTMEEQVKVAG